MVFPDADHAPPLSPKERGLFTKRSYFPPPGVDWLVCEHLGSGRYSHNDGFLLPPSIFAGDGQYNE